MLFRSGQHWLKHFRGLGFETFGSVIDESYDSVEDPTTRWQMAYEQVKYLCKQDQRIILDKLQPVLEHNYNHLWTTKWRSDLDQQVLAVLPPL